MKNKKKNSCMNCIYLHVLEVRDKEVSENEVSHVFKCCLYHIELNSPNVTECQMWKENEHAVDRR